MQDARHGVRPLLNAPRAMAQVVVQRQVTGCDDLLWQLPFSTSSSLNSLCQCLLEIARPRKLCRDIKGCSKATEAFNTQMRSSVNPTAYWTAGPELAKTQFKKFVLDWPGLSACAFNEQLLEASFEGVSASSEL